MKFESKLFVNAALALSLLSSPLLAMEDGPWNETLSHPSAQVEAQAPNPAIDKYVSDLVALSFLFAMLEPQPVRAVEPVWEPVWAIKLWNETLSHPSAPVEAQASNPAIDKYVSDLFEGNQSYGNFNKNIARKVFKKIKDDQLREHIIQTCKTVFPDYSYQRAELLDILCKYPEEIIHISIDILERNKEYIKNIQGFLPRIEACKVLLGREKTLETASAKF